MVTFSFPPLTDSVKVKFMCDVCAVVVESEWLKVPRANCSGDNREESLQTEEYTAVCPKCGKEFTIIVGESICGGEGWIENLLDPAPVDTETISLKE
jgi:hypothetical protein